MVVAVGLGEEIEYNDVKSFQPRPEVEGLWNFFNSLELMF